MTMSEFLLLLTPTWPLLVALGAAFPALRPVALRCLPWAALPALLTLAMPDAKLELPGLMLGASLQLDSTGRVFLLLTSVLWLATGILARQRVRADTSHALATFVLLAMSGAFAMALAGDGLLFFAAATVAGYALYAALMCGAEAGVRQTANVLVVLLVISDLLVFELLLLLGYDAGGFDFMTLRNGVLTANNPGFLLGLLVAGFGVKFGLLGLHYWLAPIFLNCPLAFRPALVGYMLTAGILGGLRLLPVAELSSPGGAEVLNWWAWITLIAAVLVGALQAHYRSVLGYAALALGGLWLALTGLLLAQPQWWFQASPALAATVLQSGFALTALMLLATHFGGSYSFWHGYRVAALRWVAVFLLALAPLSLVASIDEASATIVYSTMAALAFLAAASAVLVAAADREPWGMTPGPSPTPEAQGLSLPGVFMIAAGLTVAAALVAVSRLTGLSWAQLAPGAAAVLVAVVFAIATARLRAVHLPSLPPGDLLGVIRPAMAWLKRGALGLIDHTVARWPEAGRALAERLASALIGLPLGRWEMALNRWPIALTLALLLGFLIVWLV